MFQMWFNVEILAFKLSLAIDIFGFFWRWQQFWLLFKNWAFFQSSGHPGLSLLS
jgi:hypothetical protein